MRRRRRPALRLVGDAETSGDPLLDELRALAIHSPSRARIAGWEYLRELSRKDDRAAISALFARGLPPGRAGKEVRPHLDAWTPAHCRRTGILRNLYATFGLADAARTEFDKRMARERQATGPHEARPGGGAAMSLLPSAELCKVAPGHVTAMGVSLGLTAGTIMKRGTIEQQERGGRDLLTR